jgi:hypothetical protein
MRPLTKFGQSILYLGILTVCAATTVHADDPVAQAKTAPPFADLAGWWGGDGRLSFKDGKLEKVKCRATYFVEGEGQKLKQNVRCASGSGKIEVKSRVTHQAGNLTGTWKEHIYNLEGNLTGKVTPRGFKVSVKGMGAGLSANMEILVKDRMQIIEIQFFSETLIGLTLLLKKG